MPDLNAKLNFSFREDALEFASLWTVYSKRGHDISSGNENVTVSIYNLSQDDVDWINSYIEEIKEDDV